MDIGISLTFSDDMTFSDDDENIEANIGWLRFFGFLVRKADLYKLRNYCLELYKSNGKLINRKIKKLGARFKFFCRKVIEYEEIAFEYIQ